MRNTTTERLCRTCEGAGETTVNNTNPHGYGPDPQCDEGVLCDDCGGEGWIRFAPIDPLVLMAKYRKAIRSGSAFYKARYRDMRDVLRRRSYLPDRKPRDWLDAGIMVVAKAQQL